MNCNKLLLNSQSNNNFFVLWKNMRIVPHFIKELHENKKILALDHSHSNIFKPCMFFAVLCSKKYIWIMCHLLLSIHLSFYFVLVIHFFLAVHFCFVFCLSTLTVSKQSESQCPYAHNTGGSKRWESLRHHVDITGVCKVTLSLKPAHNTNNIRDFGNYVRVVSELYNPWWPAGFLTDCVPKENKMKLKGSH